MYGTELTSRCSPLDRRQGNDMKNMGAMGRTIGSLVDAQLRWQIMHENGTKEECTEALRVVLAELQAQQASKKKGKAKK